MVLTNRTTSLSDVLAVQTHIQLENFSPSALVLTDSASHVSLKGNADSVFKVNRLRLMIRTNLVSGHTIDIPYSKQIRV